MVIVADPTISPALRARLASWSGDRLAVTDHDVRRLLDDRPAAVEAWYEWDRDRAAHMMLHLDDPSRVLDLGLEHLVSQVGTARGDAGILDRDDDRYRPTVVVADPSEQAAVTAVASTPLPNRHPVLRTAWISGVPVGFERIAGSPQLGSLAPVFEGLGTTAMLASVIEYRGRGLGLLCIDEVEGERRWTEPIRHRMDDFVRRWLAPVLHASLERSARVDLSPAEREVVGLLADGLSYAEIARRLDKSVRTVDNQLRSARRRLGARNAVELVRVYERSLGPAGS